MKMMSIALLFIVGISHANSLVGTWVMESQRCEKSKQLANSFVDASEYDTRATFGKDGSLTIKADGEDQKVVATGSYVLRGEQLTVTTTKTVVNGEVDTESRTLVDRVVISGDKFVKYSSPTTDEEDICPLGDRLVTVFKKQK